MKKRLLLGTSLVTILTLALLFAGCGGGEDTASEAESAAPAEETAPAGTTEETATQTAAVHDCAGGCGMKAEPEGKMTEVEGKWYCAGCAKKIQAEGEKEGHGDG